MEVEDAPPKAAATAMQESHQHRPEVLHPRLTIVPRTNAKTLHFIRHGEGFHNVAGQLDYNNYRSSEFMDAHLTDFGWAQAHALGEHLRQARPQVDLVLVSPLTRTLETAAGVFGQRAWQPGSGQHALMMAQEAQPGKVSQHNAVCSSGAPPFLAVELCREHLGVHPCDQRRAISLYKARFPVVDFGGIASEADILWQEAHRETHAEIVERARKFLAMVMARPEQHIAVVSHASFLHHLLADLAKWQAGCSEAEMGFLVQHFENCEMRSMVVALQGAPASPDHLHFRGGRSVTRPNGHQARQLEA